MKSNYHFRILYPLLWFIICWICVEYIPVRGSDFEHFIFTLLSFVSYFLCIYNWYRSGNRIVSLYSFFVVYSAFSSIGQSLLYVLGVSDDFLFIYSAHFINDIIKMLKYVTLAIAALNLGTCIYVFKRGNNISSIEQSKSIVQSINIQHTKQELVKFLFYLSSSYMLFIAFRMLSMRQTMGYEDFYYEGKGALLGFFGTLLNYINIGLCIYYICISRLRKWIYCYVIFLIVVYMITGARSQAVPYVCILLVTMPITNPKLFRKKYAPLWIFISLFFMFTVNLVQLNRTSTLGAGSIIQPDKLMLGLYGSVSEMGLSERPALFTMNALENGSQPNYQTIAASVIQAVVPFSNTTSFVEENQIALTKWVTDYAGIEDFGLGYSFIAETFMNYGWFGWFFCIFWGYFISYAEITAYKRMSKGNYLYSIFLLVFLCIMVFWARGKFQSCINFLRYAMIFGVIYGIIKSSKKRAIWLR